MPDFESLIACPAPFHSGRFILESLVGRGGMAEVYRAYDQGLGQWRAVKIMLPDYVRKRKLRARFETEAKAMALLDHKNIVRVYDVGQHNGAPFIVMELCPGGSLEEWLVAKGPFSHALAIDCVQQTCVGVAEAHAHGVIHRDIKSQNILVGTDGRCKITDFGIAQTELTNFTNTGSAMGTLGFMAPEQRSDAKKVDHRSDVYSIGATLYNLLTGKVPTHLFAADQDDEILAGIEPEMLAVIKKATEYKREARYQTVAEFSDALTALSPDAPPNGQLSKLRGDYTPPPVPRIRRPTPTGANVRLDSAPDLQDVGPHRAPASQSDYVISVPPQHVRSYSDSRNSVGETDRDILARLPPIGAHQAPPLPVALEDKQHQATWRPARDRAVVNKTTPQIDHRASPGYDESPSVHLAEPQAQPVDNQPEPIKRTALDSLQPGPPEDDSRGFLADLLDTLVGPGKYLAIPLFLILLLGVVYYSWSTTQISSANDGYEDATSYFISSVNRNENVFDALVTLGADSVLIQSHLTDYQQATTNDEKIQAGGRLLRAARAEFSVLPTPPTSDMFASGEHRRVRVNLEQLGERFDEWENADKKRRRANAGLFGPL
ncbi:MAG: serine/threonine protein kinase [Myxococcota bacterium]